MVETPLRFFKVNEVAWYTSNSSGGTKAVGTKAANELGIYDMSGNVWEWCEDVFSTSTRRIRCGGWRDTADSCAFSVRIILFPDNRDPGRSLRLARNSGN
jgi:formylglycine-generating enzyme required for sulfatase activity